MKRFALFAILLSSSAALAQSNFTMPPPAGVTIMGLQVVATCGAGTLAATQGFATMDTTGKLCTTAGIATVQGNVSNASDAVATTSTNIPAVSYNYWWNGVTWDRAAGNTSGVFAQGTVASGATDVGNPIKVAGRYNSTLPTFVNGQRSDLQQGTRGSLNVTLYGNNSANSIGLGANGTNDPGNLYFGSVLIAQLDDTSPTAITENNFGNLRLSSERALYSHILPSAAAASGNVPVVSGSAEACHVLKASAGNLYSVYAVNLTATAGFLVVTNTTTAPADGAITPLDFAVLPANGQATINYSGPPAVYGTGITACLTSAVTVFTKTTGVITGAISGKVQ